MRSKEKKKYVLFLKKKQNFRKNKSIKFDFNANNHSKQLKKSVQRYNQYEI